MCFLVVGEVIDEMDEPIQLLMLNGPAERPAERGNRCSKMTVARPLTRVPCIWSSLKLIDGAKKDGDHRLSHEISM